MALYVSSVCLPPHFHPLFAQGLEWEHVANDFFVSSLEIVQKCVRAFFPLSRTSNMVKFSSQANSLMFVLITIQVTHNEAGSLRTQSALSSNESSSAVPKSLNVNDDKRLTTYQDILRKQVEERSSLPSVNDVKKADARGTYSYFYVGRWAWHIPLWFTLWFTFYIAFNVVRAIYGHSVS